MFFGVLAALVLGSIGSAQTEDAAKGASLLAEARKALGGEDKLAAVKRLQVKGEMRRGQGNLKLEGDTEVFLELPDKFRRNESLSLGPGGPGIDRVEVLNGNDIWDENSGGGGDRFGRGGDFGGGATSAASVAAGLAVSRTGDADPARGAGHRPRAAQGTAAAEPARGSVASAPRAPLDHRQSGRVDRHSAIARRHRGRARSEVRGRHRHTAIPRSDDAHAADDDVERRRSARRPRRAGWFPRTW